MTDRKPAHQIAYEALRDMVLFGDLAPGTAVTIEGLVSQLNLGMTPVREAIRRLIAEGALQMQGNRRVCVPRLDSGGLADLGFARLALEPHLAQRAAALVDDALVAQLRDLDAQVDSALRDGDISAYLRANHAFHFALYARAGSEVLEALAASLWLRFGPSLRAVCLVHGARHSGNALVDNHKLALDALAAGDAQAVHAAIAADVRQGILNIEAGLDKGEAARFG